MISQRPVLRMMAAVLLAGWIAAGACSDSSASRPPPDPAMRDVLPQEVTNDRENALLLVGSGFRPGIRVAIGPKLVGPNVPGRVIWVNESLVAVTFGGGLEPGDYDVGVTNLDGKFAKLDRALKIRAAGSQSPPAASPTAAPTASPTPSPSPSATPSPSPTPQPTAPPTAAPTQAPTRAPQPTAAPTAQPTAPPPTQAVPPPPRVPTLPVPGPITPTPQR